MISRDGNWSLSPTDFEIGLPPPRPILKFDRASGKVLASFGAGMFAFPHGLHVDRDGNVWVTDGQRSKDGTKGH